MPLNDIVNVSISRNTQAITQPSFSVINVLSPDCNTTNRINFYDTSDLSAVAEDLCGGVGNYTYKMLQAITAQNPSVNQVAVSAIATYKYIWITGTYTAGTLTMTINDVPISVAYNSTKAGTLADLVTAIEANTDLIATYDTSTYTNDFDAIILHCATAKPISVKDIAIAGQTGTIAMHLATPVMLTFSGTLTGGKIITNLNGVDITTNLSSDMAGTIAALETTLAADDAVATTLSTSTTIMVVPNDGYATVFDFDLSQAIGAAPTATAGFTYTESIATALAKTALESNEWYGALLVDAMSCTATPSGKANNATARANQLAFMVWVEANSKFAVIASANAGVIDTTYAADLALTTTSSIASAAQAAAYARTMVIYSANADKEFHDAALIGKLLPLTPGSWTAKFKTIASASIDNLSATQRTNAEAKNCNVNLYTAGINMIEQGCVAEGEWADIIVFIDYIKADIQANVFQVLSGALKTPYSDNGIAAVKTAIQKSGEKGIFTGGMTALQNDSDGNIIGGYKVNVPLFSATSANDRNNRVLNSVTFTFYLAGAIHAVTINGVVTTA
jgi:hypothetical protein